MKLVIGWSLLSTLLLLRVQGDVPVEELTEVQNKMIRLVMEKFHQRDLTNGFKMTSIVKAAEEAYIAGIYVNVEFLIKQTSCPKHNWTNLGCKATKNAKTYNCFGCYKFEYDTYSVISHVEECVLQRYMNGGRQTRRNELCKEVEKKNTGKNVGKYSFLRSGQHT